MTVVTGEAPVLSSYPILIVTGNIVPLLGHILCNGIRELPLSGRLFYIRTGFFIGLKG